MDPRYATAINGMIAVAMEHATGDMALATAIDDANGRVFIGVMIPCDDMPESARARLHELNADAAGISDEAPPPEDEPPTS